MRIISRIDSSNGMEQFDRYERPSERSSVVIDESLLSDAPLHELLPNIMHPTAEERDLIKTNKLINQKGKFSKIETAILNRNWNNYLRDYNIPSPLLLFGYFIYNEDDEQRKALKAEYQSFAKSTNLLLRLAKDLPTRTVAQIYARARVLFSGLKKTQELTAEERELVIKLYRKHGDDYRQICEQSGLDPKSAREFIRNRFKSTKVSVNNGPWSKEEIKLLKKNVKKVMKQQNLTSFDRIPWSVVASNMQRSDVQCRQRFFSKKIVEKVVPAQEDENVFNQKFEIAKLVALLKKMNFLDEATIDWDFIKEKFDRKLFNYLLVRWRASKMKVPDYASKTFAQIVDDLYQCKVVKKYSKKPEKLQEIEEFVEQL